jgi:hypothetical protein
MIKLEKPKDFQEVRDLSFCYLCGKGFPKNELIDHDHVPPKGAFNPRDKEPPLKLKTHRVCNGNFSAEDKKFAQLIAMRRFEAPKSPRDFALKIVQYSPKMAAIENFDVVAAAWRCISGFHAALYRQYLPSNVDGAIELPFPRANRSTSGKLQFYSLKEQHLIFVENIKRNRAFGNLDSIISNKRKMTYECVWCQFDNDPRWLCMFAWDIYDWKDLGNHSEGIPARGCAGCYVLPDGSLPQHASCDHIRELIIPNYDTLDPFAP